MPKTTKYDLPGYRTIVPGLRYSDMKRKEEMVISRADISHADDQLKTIEQLLTDTPTKETDTSLYQITRNIIKIIPVNSRNQIMEIARKKFVYQKPKVLMTALNMCFGNEDPEIGIVGSSVIYIENGEFLPRKDLELQLEYQVRQSRRLKISGFEGEENYEKISEIVKSLYERLKEMYEQNLIFDATKNIDDNTMSTMLKISICEFNEARELASLMPTPA